MHSHITLQVHDTRLPHVILHYRYRYTIRDYLTLHSLHYRQTIHDYLTLHTLHYTIHNYLTLYYRYTIHALTILYRLYGLTTLAYND